MHMLADAQELQTRIVVVHSLVKSGVMRSDISVNRVWIEEIVAP
jgi:hypothetical protein